MSIQLASTDVIQVLLDAAPATNQLPINASYVDQGGSGNNLPSITTGTTPVTIVGSPASGVERLVSQISIPNADTATRTVTVNLVRSSVASRLCKITLQAGYALYYDGKWMVLDPNGNFLCDVTVSGGSITSNQGAPAALANAWPVEVTDGTNILGTSTHPIRTDPTGTTVQPVNLADLAGSALGAPTAWGTAPGSGTQVLNVNANIVAGGSGGGNVNVTEWNTVALGSPSNYGTSPGAVSVIGVNAFVTNTVTVGTHAVTQSGSWSVALLAGSAAIGTVGVTSLPALPTGSNTIGAVTQASGPWTINLTQIGGSSLALGQALMAASIPVTLASNQSTLSTEDLGTAQNITAFALTTSAQTFGSSATKYLQGLQIDIVGATSTAAVVVNILDGGGHTLFAFGFGTLSSSTTLWNVKSFTNMAIPMNNGGSAPSVKLTNALTAGSIFCTVLYT